MYNNQDPNSDSVSTSDADLLASIVAQGNLGADLMTDFSGIVGMEDIAISDDILIGAADDGTYQHASFDLGGHGINDASMLHHVSNVVEVPNSHIYQETITTMDPSLFISQPVTSHAESSSLSLGSDVLMMDDQELSNAVASLVSCNQESMNIYEPPSELIQQHSVQPLPTTATYCPTIITPNFVQTPMTVVATSASSTIVTRPPQMFNYGGQRYSLASTSQGSIRIATPTSQQNQFQTMTSIQEQQPKQPFFVMSQQVPNTASYSYIVPASVAGSLTATTVTANKQTVAVKGGTTPSNMATFVINQGNVANKMATTTTNLKVVQTSQGQQLILAAPYKPTTSTATKSTAIAIKQGPVTGQKSMAQPQTIHLTTANAHALERGQVIHGSSASTSTTSSSQPQSLIILSPVKQSHPSGTATKTYAMPAKKLFPATSGGTTRLQQIAPSNVLKGQRVLAPAPIAISQVPTGHKSGISITSAGTKPIQTIVHTGAAKNVQYISFVPMSSASTMSIGGGHHPIQNQTQAKMITSTSSSSSGITSKLIPLKPLGSAGQPVATKQTIITTQSLKPNLVHLTTTSRSGQAQKLLINPSTIKINAAPSAGKLSTVTSSSSSSGGTTTGAPTQFWMKVEGATASGTGTTTTIHLQPTNKPICANTSGSLSSGGNNTTGTAPKYVPIAPHPSQITGGALKIEDNRTNVIARLPHLQPNPPVDNHEESRRKPCNCTRSQCLKLYCDCFANGEFCNNCNCVSCCNNLSNEEIRQKAIRLCLERNPNAFHPKIGQQAAHGDVERKHTKGCCCKRSGCLKNYCECYEAKILCSDKCKCVGCKNFEESTERKTLMYLADAAEVRSVQQAYAASKMQVWGPDLKLKLPVKVKSDCHPFNIFTDEILDATASCLLAQAEEGEFERLTEANVEALVIEQFGECLSQILNMGTAGGQDDLDDMTEDGSETDKQSVKTTNGQSSSDAPNVTASTRSDI